MDSLDALKLLDDVADAMTASQGRQRRYRADQFLTFMHARGWRVGRGEPVMIDRETEEAEPIQPALKELDAS